MRSIQVLTLALLMVAQSLTGATNELNVMTFNLRFASNSKPNSWPERRPVVKALLDTTKPDVIGTQEGLYGQLDNIAEDQPDYAYIGVGREGGSRGEFSAIFYRKNRLIAREYDHFWLSETPALIGSKSWNSSLPRMVTWARFADRGSGREFYVFNTHFDHMSQAARTNSSALIRSRVEALKTTLPVFVIGDFNASAGRNPAYEILLGDGVLIDSWPKATERRGKEVATFHNFKGPREADDRIDWVTYRGPVKPIWTEINTFSRDGQFPSDHFPVSCQFRFSE